MHDRSEHPPSEELTLFLRAENRPETDAIVRRHLQDGCVSCLLELRRLLRAVRARDRPELAFRRSESVGDWARRWAPRVERQSFLVDVERRVAEGLVSELLLLSPAERRERIRTRERYRLFGLAEALTEKAREQSFVDLLRAVEMGELAVAVAEELDPRLYPRGLGADTEALAWTALANAHRARTDLRTADRLLATGLQRFEEGTGEPSIRAELLSLVGSLRIDQARFDEAVAALEEAAALLGGKGRSGGEGKILVQLAKAAGEAGNPERAVEVLERAEGLIDPVAEPRLFLYAVHARSLWLLDAGRLEDAAILFEELEPRYTRTLRGFHERMRLDWLGAKVALARGDFDRAETALDALRTDCVEHEEDYLFAMVTLDLAALHLREGRTAEVRRMAEEMLPILTSRQIHHHALAALLLFERAAAAETASAALVRDVATYLRRARNNPDLRFEGGEPTGGTD